MNNGRLDRALLLALLAALGGVYWQMFSMNRLIADVHVQLSADIADVNQQLSAEIADLSERLTRVETHLEHIVPRLADPPPGQSTEG